MNVCTNIATGKLLHAYEHGMLAVTDVERFEAHVMECEFCLAELQELRDIILLMKHDQDCVDVIAVAESVTESRANLWLRVRNALWPDRVSFVLRPVFLILIAVAMSPFALRGLLTKQTGVEQPSQINLTSIGMRSGTPRGVPSVEIGKEQFLIINVSVEEANSASSLTWNLTSEQAGQVVTDELVKLDENSTAALLVPTALLRAGFYTLTISATDSASTSSLLHAKFLIVNKRIADIRDSNSIR